MTPDLMEAGAQRYEKVALAVAPGQTESGGRSAGYGRVHTPGEVDTTGWYDPQHGEVPDASKDERGVYSFCMCPGGQIVPTSTDPELLCINGMSFSK